jgi:hypothetical protein
MSESAIVTAEAEAPEAQDTTTEAQATRVFYRSDYNRARILVLKARQARHGKPWDGKAPEAQVTVDIMAGTLAGLFKADNPWFDSHKFLAACALPEAPSYELDDMTAGDDPDLDDPDLDDADEAGDDELATMLADEAADQAIDDMLAGEAGE